jgi:hypothetical protein
MLDEALAAVVVLASAATECISTSATTVSSAAISTRAARSARTTFVACSVTPTTLSITFTSIVIDGTDPLLCSSS